MSLDTLSDRQHQLNTLLEVVDVIDALREACFQPDPRYPSCLVWVGTWEQEKLVINAAPWLFDWRLYASCVGRRTWTDHEFMLPDRVARGLVLQKLCEVWRGQFPRVTPPESIRAGQLYGEFARMKRRLNPGTPHLSLDGAMLRAIVRRLTEIEQRTPGGLLHLGYSGNQMILKTGDREFHCPGWGAWFGEATLPLKDFLTATPTRLRKSGTRLTFEAGWLQLEHDSMGCEWTESN